MLRNPLARCVWALPLLLSFAAGAEPGSGTAPQPPRVWIVSVGVSKYHNPGYVPLSYADLGARRVATAMNGARPQATTAVVLSSQTSDKTLWPTVANVTRELGQIRRKAQAQDLFVFYFCGHGVEEGGSQYLLLMDADLTDTATRDKTCLPLDSLRRDLEALPCQGVLLWLDACRNPVRRSGATAGTPMSRDFLTSGGDWRTQPGRVFGTLFACGEGELSNYNKEQQSLFTETLVQGLKGEAAEKGGQITLAGLSNYVERRVPQRVVDELGPDVSQQPALKLTGTAEEAILRPELAWVAVLPFAGGQGEAVSDTVQTRLAESGAVNLVERIRIAEAVEELRRQNLGLTEPENQARIGKMTNAKYVLVGSVLSGDRGPYQANCRLVVTETAQNLPGIAASVPLEGRVAKGATVLADDLLAKMRGSVAPTVTLVGSKKGKSNMGLILGGVAGAGAVAALAGGGGGGGGGGTPAAVNGTVSGYVYRPTAPSGTPWLRFSQQAAAPPGLEPASGANVTAASRQVTTVNGDGSYSLSLPSGTYTLTASLAGHHSATAVVVVTAGMSTGPETESTAPQVTGATSPDSTHVDITFSEALSPDSISGATVTLTPSLRVVSTQLVGENTLRLLTDEQNGSQTYTVAVSGVTDLAGNALSASANAYSFRGTGDRPVISSVRVVDSMHVEIVFSEALDAASAAAPAGYTFEGGLAAMGADLQADRQTVWVTTEEQTNGASYRVAVSGVKDVAGNPVASGSQADFTGRGIPPTVERAAAVDQTHVDVFFSEAVDTVSALEKANYSIDNELGVAAVELHADRRGVRLTTTAQTGGTPYKVTAANVKDARGNAISGSNVATFTGAGASGVPLQVLAAATALDGTHVEVRFSKTVEKASAETAGNYTITPDLAVSAAQLQGDGVTVRLTTAAQQGGASYTVTVSGVKDSGGTTIGSANNTAAFTAGVVPLRVITATAASDGKHVDVTFNKAVGASGTAAANYAIAPNLVVSGAESLDNGLLVRLATTEMTTGTSYTVTLSNVTGAAGEALDPSAKSTVFQGLGVAPVTNSATAQSDGTHVDVLFSEALETTSAGTAGNYSISPTLAVTAAQLQADGRTVRLTTGDQTGGTAYTVTVTGVKDAAGNRIGSTGNTSPFGGIAPPFLVASAQSIDATTVEVVFNRAVGAASGGTAGNYGIAPSLAVSAAAVQSDARRVRLTTAAQAGGATYTLTVTGVKDGAGNPIASPNNTAAFTGLAPAVVSATAVDAYHVDVLFTRALDAATANAAANYAVSPSIGLTAAALQSDNVTVRLTTAAQSGGVSYTVTVTGVKDGAGNPIGSSSNTGAFTGITPLSLSAGSVSQTGGAAGSNLGDYEYRVTYTHQGNVAPAYVRLTIYKPDGSPMGTWDMAKADASDVTYTDGCAHTWRSSVLIGGVGAYTYRFDASDGTAAAAPGSGSGPAVSAQADSRIAFEANTYGPEEILSTALDGGEAIRLTNAGGADQDATWSPDGSRMAFVSNRDGNGEIYVMEANGSGQTRLTSNTAYDGHPSWSPDGARIAFHSTRDGNTEIYVMNADGSGQARVTNETAVDARPAWSPDGTRIAFESERDGNFEIYTVKPDGSQPTRLTNQSGSDIEVAWAPDGKLAFASNRDGNWEVYSMAGDGTGQARLTSSTAIDNHPTWSPDGTRLAFISDRAVAFDIYVMRADGMAPTRVTTSDSLDAAPAWSAGPQAPSPYSATATASAASISANGSDTSTITVTVRDGGYRPFQGATVSFSTTLGSLSTNSAVTDANGQASVTLTAGSTAGTATVTASVAGGKAPVATAVVRLAPSGRMVFESDRDGNAEIYTMDPDGANQTRLTNNSANDQSPAWSPDGRRIVFGSWRDGNSEIYVMDADGANQTRLTNNAANDYTPAWSPDGTKIAFVSNRDGYWGIYVMDADGSAPAAVAPGTAPAWSPDGSKIAFALSPSGVGGVYVMKADGSGQTRLAVTGGYEGIPAWSPDGSKIAFDSYVGGYTAINVMNADGTGQTLLASGAAHNSEASWSPDGTQIAFGSGRDGTHYQIYVMNADGTGQTRVTNTQANDSRPSWSDGPQSPSPYSATMTTDHTIIAPSGYTATLTVTVRDGHYAPFAGATVNFGTTLGNLGAASAVTNASGQATVTLTAGSTPGTATVTASVAGGKAPSATAAVKVVGDGVIAFERLLPGDVDLFTVKPDGTNETNVTNTTTWSDQEPAWSADGTRIVFHRNANGGGDNLREIWKINADGTGATQLTSNSVPDMVPSWSPDGTRIAFCRGWAPYEIYVMNADGTGQTNITNTGSSEYGPTWSPDGTKIAFGSYADGDGEIYLMTPAGANWTRLTDNTSEDGAPTWSPDGTKIAFTSARDGNYEVYVMNADGTNQTRLTNNSASDWWPSWSPDGSRIAFMRGAAYDGDVYVMNADGTGQTQITSGKKVYMPRWSPGTSPSGRGAGAATPRREAETRLRAVCGEAEAMARLTALGVEAEVARGAAQGEHAGSPLRFVAVDDAGRTRLPSSVPGRSWAFQVEAPAPDAEVTLTWPDLSGIGSKERVVLEDLGAGVKRSMRTSASYVFHGPRRFRVRAEARTGPALITGLEVTAGRANGRLVRFTLSAPALVDLEVLAPTGRVVGAVARGRSSEAGLNQVAWAGATAPGIYLLRATASDEEGGRVQIVRPIIVPR